MLLDVDVSRTPNIQIDTWPSLAIVQLVETDKPIIKYGWIPFCNFLQFCLIDIKCIIYLQSARKNEQMQKKSRADLKNRNSNIFPISVAQFTQKVKHFHIFIIFFHAPTLLRFLCLSTLHSLPRRSPLTTSLASHLNFQMAGYHYRVLKHNICKHSYNFILYIK